jgi:phage terminase large subunit
MDFKFLDAYAPIIWSNKPYYVITGGRSSGKSTQVAAYFLIKLLGDDYFRGVISRYAAKSIKFSIYKDILDLAQSWGVLDSLRIVGEEINNPSNKNQIITHSFKIADGNQSAKGKGLSRVTHLIIDEAQEITKEEEYIKVIDTFRVKGAERKIFVVLNPSSKNHWIFKRWYLPDGNPNYSLWPDHEFIHTTYLDNKENIDEKKIEEWERMKNQDPLYYSHHILGHWKNAYEGTIYSKWSFNYEPPSDALTLYGLDWGFSNDPTACIEVKKKGNKIWLREVLYNKGLTNDLIWLELNRKGLDSQSLVIADSAEPKSIEDIRKMGLRRVKGAKKGPGSVIQGIKKISSYEVFVDPLSSNIIQEYECYRWKQGTDQPMDADNHLMDALRYAMSEEQTKLNLSFV